ncbi:MAG: GTP cyclohydrolase II [Rhizobacter sp.]
MSALTSPLRPHTEESPPAAELAAVRVDRACSELRHGRPIALHELDGAGCCLAAAVETLSPARLQELVRLSGARMRLLLTAERLQAMGWADASTPLALSLDTPITVEQVQLLCAVTPGCVDESLLGEAEPAGPAMLAALTLCKRARLTPALLVAELPASRSAALDAALVHRVPADEVMQVASRRAWALQRVSDARVPIAAHDDCKLVLFREIDGDAEHVAIIVGQPALHEPVPVRLHSSCLTGDLLGSLRCDCGDQLQRAIEHLAVAGGVLLYLAQEGRGTGLANKLRAYRLQDGGLDTLQADRYLGFREDERDFQAAAAMLQALGIARIRLLTNNPHKIDALRDAGIEVVDRVPLLADVNTHNARYVQTKHEHAGHLRADESHG